MYDVIIIGAGPAGMTAAIYARRANKSVLLIEAFSYGGQIINTKEIDNYPVEPHISGYEFVTKLYNQVKELGGVFCFEKAFEIINHETYKEVRTNNDRYKGKTIIIASGTAKRKLGLENEERLIGKGISYCATCDGSFYKNKDVAVVGGGNTALEDALYLSDIAKKVILIHRREEFRADQKTVDLVTEKKNIVIEYNSIVEKIIGEDHLESIILKKEKKEKEISVQGLFIAIGQTPQNDAFKNLIKLDKNGYIVASENCHTNIEGIYAAGDSRTKELRQLVTATSDGAIAATEAIKYINSETP